MRHLIALGLVACTSMHARTLRFSTAESERDMREIGQAIASVAGVAAPDIDAAARTIAFEGTAAQVATAEWLFDRLNAVSTERAEYPLPEGEQVVVVHAPHAKTVQDFQEIATCARSIAEVRTLFTTNAARAVVMRGPAPVLAAAEWVVRKLDGEEKLSTEIEPPAFQGETLAVVYVPATPTLQSFQEIATAIRSTGDIRRIFTYNAERALVVRGTREQIGLARWMGTELTRPDSAPSEPEYRMPGDLADAVVRVFYLPGTITIEQFHARVTAVRTATDMRRAFAYNPRRAVVLRGTRDQMEFAATLFQQQQP